MLQKNIYSLNANKQSTVYITTKIPIQNITIHIAYMNYKNKV